MMFRPMLVSMCCCQGPVSVRSACTRGTAKQSKVVEHIISNGMSAGQPAP